MKTTKLEANLKNEFKNGNFETLKLSKKERDHYSKAAKVALAKNLSITIRINGNVLKALKDIALNSGKKYQTYIGELLHEHVTKRRRVA